MAFHVQLTGSMRRAQEFNLSEPELRERILEPWVSGDSVAVGDRHWDPGKSRIVVLEGPALDAPELAHGQGWNSALRTGQDVTRAVFEERPAVATSIGLLAGSDAARGGMASLLTDLSLVPVDWSVVRERLLAGEAAGVAAVVVVVDGPLGEAAFDVGMAFGALGPRAIMVRPGDGPAPPELARVEAIRPQALVERLRACGCDVGPGSS